MDSRHGVCSFLFTTLDHWEHQYRIYQNDQLSMIWRNISNRSHFPLPGKDTESSPPVKDVVQLSCNVLYHILGDQALNNIVFGRKAVLAFYHLALVFNPSNPCNGLLLVCIREPFFTLNAFTYSYSMTFFVAKLLWWGMNEVILYLFWSTYYPYDFYCTIIFFPHKTGDVFIFIKQVIPF